MHDSLLKQHYEYGPVPIDISRLHKGQNNLILPRITKVGVQSASRIDIYMNVVSCFTRRSTQLLYRYVHFKSHQLREVIDSATTGIKCMNVPFRLRVAIEIPALTQKPSSPSSRSANSCPSYMCAPSFFKSICRLSVLNQNQ